MSKKTAYDLKLAQIDEYLLACGWERQGNYWKPPAEIAYAMRFHAPNIDTAVWRRCHAVMIQVQRDEAAATAVRRTSRLALRRRNGQVITAPITQERKTGAEN
jgi:hypothetical protein